VSTPVGVAWGWPVAGKPLRDRNDLGSLAVQTKVPFSDLGGRGKLHLTSSPAATLVTSTNGSAIACQSLAGRPAEATEQPANRRPTLI
jgi:hypothetical protein